jgi:hypothetical protein
VDEKELLTVWLADKILDTVKNEDEVQGDGFFETSQDLFFCFHLNLYSTLVSENGKRDMLFQTSKYSEKGRELDICASILYL